jgi:hypothetical protein
MVETLKPFEPRVVDSLVSITFSKVALIEGWEETSFRMKVIPVSAGAGLIVRLTACPEWSPIPVQLVSSLMVRCL